MARGSDIVLLLSHLFARCGECASLRRIVLLFFTPFFLISCTHVHHAPIEAEALKVLLSGEPLFGSAAHEIELPSENPLALTEEMKRYADLMVGRALKKGDRAETLHQTILHPGALGLDYQPYLTLTAAEAFDQRQGNCLTFTALYYAMGKYLGLKVFINEVEVPLTWDLQGDQTFVLFRHVNAMVKVNHLTRIIVDLDMNSYNQGVSETTLSEQELTVQYYNNRAMESLNANQYKKAFGYFKKALTLNPSDAAIWSNFGVFYNRLGHDVEAEIAFKHALMLKPSHRPPAMNLVHLYENRGETENALQYERLVRFHQSKNPFYQYYLAKRFYDQQRWNEARTKIQNAITLNQDEHRFYHLQAQIMHQLGDHERALRSLTKAAEVAEVYDRARYERKLSALNQ
ncbi:tetratricopeptide repeat protein [Marinibactrum halimedae]|nr:tetratricopeptide repeat protein [Marinibactrum halimedae]